MPNPRSSSRNTLARVVERRFVQWLLAYLAAAWVFVQVAALLGDQFQWPEAVQRAITVTAFSGALPIAVLSWFHGEKGAQRVTSLEAALLAIASALAVAAGAVAYQRGAAATEREIARRQSETLGHLTEGARLLDAGAGAVADLEVARLCQQAERRFEDALELTPAQVDGWAGLAHARACVAAHLPREREAYAATAQRAAGKVAALAPGSVQHHVVMNAMAHQITHDRQARVEHARHAHELDPGDRRMLRELVAALRDTEDYAALRDLVGKRLIATPDDPWLWQVNGDIAAVARNWRTAREHYERAIALETPASVDLYIAVSWMILSETGDLDATEHYLRAIEVAYGRSYSWVYQIWNLELARGNLQRAIEMLERADASDWPDLAKEDLLAEAYYYAGDRERAARLAPILLAKYERDAVLTADGPGRAMALALAGQVHALHGDRRRAVEYLDQAMASIPPGPRRQSDIMVSYFIGMWYGIAGEPAKGVEVLEEAFRHPDPWHTPNMVWFAHGSTSLRSYPPFVALMRRLGANVDQGYRPIQPPGR